MSAKKFTPKEKRHIKEKIKELEKQISFHETLVSKNNTFKGKYLDEITKYKEEKEYLEYCIKSK